MDTKRKQRLYTELNNLAARLRGEIAAISEQAQRTVGGQGAGEITNAPQHLGDVGSEEFQRGLDLTLLENEDFLAQEVRDALGRLENGRFGICEGCGQPIADARLEAIPYTRFCVQCAEKSENTFEPNYNAGRPGMDESLPTEIDEDEGAVVPVDPHESPVVMDHEDDIHAVGTPGGGTALGGLAGTTEGHGDPDDEPLEDAMGGSEFDAEEDRPVKPNTEEVLS